MLETSVAFQSAVNAAAREWKALVIFDFVEGFQWPWATVEASSVYDDTTSPQQVVNGRFRPTDYVTSGYPTFMGLLTKAEKGWWSGNLSDGNGVVAESLTLTYTLDTSGKVLQTKSFWVVGDPLNYPVDFTVMYSEDLVGDWITLQTVTGNNSPVWYYRTTSGCHIRRIKIEVTKISAANAPVKILEAGAIVKVVFDSQDIVSFDLTEELSSDATNNPLGLVSSDEFTLLMRNDEHWWTSQNLSTPFYGLVKPEVVVRPYLGIKVAPKKFEFEALGKFWVKEWKAPSQTTEATFVCLDRIAKFTEDPVPTMRIQSNITLQELWRRFFELVGLSADEYWIDPSIKPKVEKGWLPVGRQIDTLQILAVASMAYVKADRTGKIIVRSLFTGQDPTALAELQDTNQIFTIDNPKKISDVYSKVIVKYTKLSPKIGQSVLEVRDLEVPTGGTTLTQVEFSESPVSQLESVKLKGATNSSIDAIEYGASDITIALLNPSDTEVVNIEAIATYMEQLKLKYEGRNYEAYVLYGDRTLTVDNYLIQSLKAAQYYAVTLNSTLNDPYALFEIEARGNPSLEVGDIVTLVDPSDKIGTVKVMLTKAKWSFDGSLSTGYTARKPLTPRQWVFILPCFSTYVAMVIETVTWEYVYVHPGLPVLTPKIVQR